MAIAGDVAFVAIFFGKADGGPDDRLGLSGRGMGRMEKGTGRGRREVGPSVVMDELLDDYLRVNDSACGKPVIEVAR